MNYKEEALKMIEQGRVVFPLTDMDGNITGVTGKLTLKKDPTVPTYVVRGTGFFGNFNTERDEIIVTEGTVDVLMAQTYKYDNVISCLHAGNWKKVFTDDVLERLAKIKKKIIIFFDNDDLGQRNAKSLCEKMKEYGIDVYNYQPLYVRDMQEYIRQGLPINNILSITSKCFYTGVFSVANISVANRCYPYFKAHEENDDFDDDVLSWIKNENKSIRKNFNDGYVTNVGTEVTIHIKSELNNEHNIELIKKVFGITESNKRITKVIVEETDVVF